MDLVTDHVTQRNRPIFYESSCKVATETKLVLFLSKTRHFEIKGGVIGIIPLKYSIISPMSLLNSLADTLL